jgi:hypothetical protein
MGTFTGASFGLEIIVESMAYVAKIALARKVVNVIEVSSLNPTARFASNDATYFMHWHAKEECLNFIDPSAFWGSFFAARLRVWDAAHTEFDRKSGNEIYQTVLRGAYDDSSATAGELQCDREDAARFRRRSLSVLYSAIDLSSRR